MDRARAPFERGVLAERYERMESNEGETTLADTDSTVLDFSGKPDAIILTCRAFGALFTLSDRLGRETSEVVVLPNQQLTIRAARQRVVGRNLVAGSNAIVNVVGLWAAAPERV
jgi:hypothetical protein